MHAGRWVIRQVGFISDQSAVALFRLDELTHAGSANLHNVIVAAE